MIGKSGLTGLDDLSELNETSLQDILINLLNGDSDLALKTQIFNPKDLAGVKILATALEMEGLDGSAELLNEFLKTYLRFMVSYKRQSRTEIINAISGLINREMVKMTISDKMTKDLK